MRSDIEKALRVQAPIILKHFGHEPQMIATCEELGELTTALCKRINRKTVTEEQVIDEIADCFIMLNQMRLIFGENAVDDRIRFKLDRTMKFISEKKK